MKTIQEFPNYKITDDGRVFNLKGKELKRQENVDGYWVVNLYQDGKYYHRRCARMVGLTYLSNTYEEGLLINHIDLDIKNDSISNLEWVTPKENCEHSIINQPEVHRKPSEYSDKFIEEICQLIENGYRNVDIKKLHNITTDILFDIRSGDSWKFISCKYNMKPSNKGISKETATWVCYRLKEGLTYDEILALSTCRILTKSILKSIKYKRTWVHVSEDILD